MDDAGARGFRRRWTYNGGAADKLGVAEQSGGSMVVAV